MLQSIGGKLCISLHFGVKELAEKGEVKGEFFFGVGEFYWDLDKQILFQDCGPDSLVGLLGKKHTETVTTLVEKFDLFWENTHVSWGNAS